MWALKQLHRLLISNGSTTIFVQMQQLMTSDSALTNLLEELPQALLRQYEYEDVSVRAGLHLMNSDFFKVCYISTVINVYFKMNVLIYRFWLL